MTKSDIRLKTYLKMIEEKILYIHNEKFKDVANILALILSIIIPVITLILLIYKI